MLRSRWMLVAMVLVGTACVLADLLLVPTATGQSVTFAVMTVAAGVAVIAALRRPRTVQEPWFLCWLLLELAGCASAFAIHSIGDAVTYPSFADACWIVGGLALLAALVARIRRAVPLVDPTMLLDSTVVATSAGLVLWITVMAPGVSDATISLPARITAAAYPVLDIAILGLLGYFWGVVPDRRREAPLVIGIALLLAGDLLFVLRSSSGLATAGGPIRPTLVVAVVLLATVVGRGAPVDEAPAVPRPHSYLRVWILVAAALLPLVLVTVTAFDDWLFPASQLPLALLVSTALVVAMTCRLVALSGRSGRLASTLQQHRFEALAHASTDVIAVIDADRRFRYVSPTMPASWRIAPHELVGEQVDVLVGAVDRSRLHAEISAVIEGIPGGSRTVELALDDGVADDARAEVILVNLVDDPAVGGLGLTIRDLTNRLDFERELRNLAFHDGLTGMANRALFAERLGTALDAIRAVPSRRSAMLFIDLDDFKGVNDSLGHGAGDALLVEIARRIRACTREQDTAARIGGDEFAVLLEDLDRESEIEAVAIRLIESIQRPVPIQGSMVSVGGSIGVRVLDASSSSTVAMRDADLAMYRAKNNGKGRYEIYAPELHEAALASFELRSQLEEAVKDQQLELYYQTIHELGSHRLVGAEALLRWQHPERGLMLPGDFIDTAEQSGLIVPIGSWAITRACEDIARLNAISPTPLWVSVNVSPLQFSAVKLATVVRNALTRSRVPAGLLRLEITESVLLDDSVEPVSVLEELRAMGAKIAIDDFGTGYSSMSYLQRYPVDVVKIDRSFVNGGQQNAAGIAITESILRLADALGLACVAEGIESVHDHDLLDAMGCRYGQGFLYSRPMPVDEFEAIVREDIARRRLGDDRRTARRRPRTAGVPAVAAGS